MGGRGGVVRGRGVMGGRGMVGRRSMVGGGGVVYRGVAVDVGGLLAICWNCGAIAVLMGRLMVGVRGGGVGSRGWSVGGGVSVGGGGGAVVRGGCRPVMGRWAGAVLWSSVMWGNDGSMMGQWTCAVMGKWTWSMVGHWTWSILRHGAWAMVGHGAGVMWLGVMDKRSGCYIMMNLMVYCSEGRGVHIGGWCGWKEGGKCCGGQRHKDSG